MKAARTPYHRFAVISLLALACAAPVLAQTNPTPQALPYVQDFGTLPSSSTVYPPGWQGWLISTAPGATFNTTGPIGDVPLTANGTAASSAGGVYNYSGKIGYLNALSGDRTVTLAVDGTGRTNISVGYAVMTIRNPQDATNTRVNEVVLQYRVGASGAWTSLLGTAYQNLFGPANNQTGAVTTPQNLQSRSTTLPAACDNQPIIQLRWASREVGGSGSRPSFAVDDLSVSGSLITYTISASAGSGGTIQPSGSVGVSYGSSQMFTISAQDACHEITDVLVDGVSVGAVGSYTFTNVTADHTISASFALLSYTVTANAVGPGTVDPSGVIPVSCGSNLTINALVNPGAEIRQVVVNGDSIGPVGSYTFVSITSNNTFTCYFKMPLTAPAYEPDKWNDGKGDPPSPDNGQSKNNCYNYATNKHNGKFAQPGESQHQNRERPDCDSLKAFAQEDGLAFLGKDQAARDSVCVNGYKVALFVGWACGDDGHHRSRGYHWYRQDAGGNWSHKPGKGAATDRDQSNQPITNPETADKGTCLGHLIGDPPVPRYSEFCGYFCVTKQTNVGRPSNDDAPQSTGGDDRITLANQIIASPWINSGEPDTVVVFSAQADLDSITGMITGLAPVPDPAWPSILGYRGYGLEIDSVATFGSALVRAWNGVVQVDQDTTRSFYADAHGLEAWLDRRFFGPPPASVPDPSLGGFTTLGPARPNPFRISTTIPFTLGRVARVEARIYDLGGRLVRRIVAGTLGAGPHAVRWDGRDDASTALRAGTYFYRLIVDGRAVGARRAVLLK